MILSRFGAILALWVLALAPAAAQPVEPGEEGDLAILLPPVHGEKACFAHAYDAAELAGLPQQKVTDLLFGLEYYRHEPDQYNPQGQRNYYFRLSAKLKDIAETLYSAGECAVYGGEVSCGVDCDGGMVLLDVEAGGAGIVLSFDEQIDRLRMTMGCSESEAGPMMDLTPETAGGQAFTLAKVDAAMCKALEER